MRKDVAGALKAVERSEESHVVRAQFCFSSELAVFEGHFPGEPLIPGVMQIEMVRSAVEAFTGTRHGIARVVKAKFVRAIIPDEMVDLHITVRPENGVLRVKAELSVEMRSAASISLILKAVASKD